MQLYKPWSEATLKTLVTKAQEELLEKKTKKANQKRKADDVQSNSDSDSDEESDEDSEAASLQSGDATTTSTIDAGSFVIVHAEKSAHWPFNWSLARVISVAKDRKTFNVQWYGTYTKSKPWSSQMKPGWIDYRDGKCYFQQNAMSKHDSRWTSTVEMKQIFVWGINHFQKTGYLGAAVRDLVEQFDLAAISTYTHRSWFIVSNDYSRKFTTDSEPALRIWMAAIRLANDEQRFTNWSSKHNISLYSRTVNDIGWAHKASKQIVKHFQYDFLPTLDQYDYLIQTILKDLFCHRYFILNLQNNTLVWKSKHRLTRNVIAIPQYEFDIDGHSVQSGPCTFVLENTDSLSNMWRKNGIFGPNRTVEAGENLQAAAHPWPAVKFTESKKASNDSLEDGFRLGTLKQSRADPVLAFGSQETTRTFGITSEQGGGNIPITKLNRSNE